MENRTYRKRRPPLGWLWTDEAAEHLGIHPNTLWRWRRDGYGPPCVQHGQRRFRYRVTDLNAWLDLEAGRISDSEYAAA
jgi:predicted site-specific integrase-resolvase